MVEIKLTIPNENVPALKERVIEFRSLCAEDMQASSDVNPRTRSASKVWHVLTSMLTQIREHEGRLGKI
jgi:hypothetical protein